VAKDVRVNALAGDPHVLPAQLVALHLPDGMAADAPFGQFLDAMAAQRRMTLLPEVAELFEAYKRESESQLLVKVTSAIALDAAQTEQLKASLKRRFKREIELETQVDASLLGGVVIDTGSEVIDGSARGRLARLSGALMH
jgi:F-type H+-transporting ATPase subunit delta